MGETITQTFRIIVEWNSSRGTAKWIPLKYYPEQSNSTDEARSFIEECQKEDGRTKNRYRIVEIVTTEHVIEEFVR